MLLHIRLTGYAHFSAEQLLVEVSFSFPVLFAGDPTIPHFPPPRRSSESGSNSGCSGEIEDEPYSTLEGALAAILTMPSQVRGSLTLCREQSNHQRPYNHSRAKQCADLCLSLHMHEPPSRAAHALCVFCLGGALTSLPRLRST